MTRGRRKDLTIPPSRALVQQRDYRARKAQYVQDLEERCRRLEEQNALLTNEVHHLRFQLDNATGNHDADGPGGPSAPGFSTEMVTASVDLLQTLSAAVTSVNRFQQIALDGRNTNDTPMSAAGPSSSAGSSASSSTANRPLPPIALHPPTATEYPGDPPRLDASSHGTSHSHSIHPGQRPTVQSQAHAPWPHAQHHTSPPLAQPPRPAASYWNQPLTFPAVGPPTLPSIRPPPFSSAPGHPSSSSPLTYLPPATSTSLPGFRTVREPSILSHPPSAFPFPHHSQSADLPCTYGSRNGKERDRATGDVDGYMYPLPPIRPPPTPPPSSKRKHAREGHAKSASDSECCDGYLDCRGLVEEDEDEDDAMDGRRSHSSHSDSPPSHSSRSRSHSHYFSSASDARSPYDSASDRERPDERLGESSGRRTLYGPGMPSSDREYMQERPSGQGSGDPLRRPQVPMAFQRTSVVRSTASPSTTAGSGEENAWGGSGKEGRSGGEGRG